MRRVLLLATALAGLSPAAKADALFTTPSTFDVSGLNSPETFVTAAILTGNGLPAQPLGSGILTLAVSIVPDATGEWLVFNYSSGPIACGPAAPGGRGSGELAVAFKSLEREPDRQRELLAVRPAPAPRIAC